MGDFEGFKISVKEVTAVMVEIAIDFELEVDPRDITELLQSHDKTLVDEEIILISGWAKKVISWDESYPWGRYCEDCCNDNKGF